MTTDPKELYKIGKTALQNERYDIAVDKFEMACTVQNYDRACDALGELYGTLAERYKNGNADEVAKAKEYYSKSCNMGNRPACTEFSTMAIKFDDSEFDDLLEDFDKQIKYELPYEEMDKSDLKAMNAKAEKIEKYIMDIIEAEKKECNENSEKKVRYTFSSDGSSACVKLPIHYKKIGLLTKARDVEKKNCEIGDKNACNTIKAEDEHLANLVIKCDDGDYEACIFADIIKGLTTGYGGYNLSNFLDNYKFYRTYTGYLDYLKGDYKSLIQKAEVICSPATDLLEHYVYSACELIGYLYDQGKGVEVDKAKASNYYGLACKLTRRYDFHKAAACMRISEMYMLGDGLPKDIQKAKEYREAACKKAEYAPACK